MILKHIKTFQGGKLEHIINEPNLTITTANTILQQEIGISRMKEELTILLNKVNNQNQNQNQNQIQNKNGELSVVVYFFQYELVTKNTRD